MSKELNQKFVNDPKAFADLTPVVAPGSKATANRVKTWKDKPEEFKGVPGSLRIIAGDLNAAGDHADLTINYDQVAAKLVAGWMAMYYLPWLPDNHVRTTLRPRSMTTRTGEKKDIAKLDATNGYQDANDPDIFFTAAVDGCMVSVTGPLDEPVVFHSNAQNLDTDTATGSKEDERVIHMTKGLQTFDKVHPKLARNSIAEPSMALAATANMYMSTDRQAELYGKGQRPITENTKFDDKKLMGTIFGKRQKDRHWIFYYERLIRYDLWAFGTQNEINFDKDPPVREDITAWRPKGSRYRLDTPVQEFWPGGTGHVLFKK